VCEAPESESRYLRPYENARLHDIITGVVDSSGIGVIAHQARSDRLDLVALSHWHVLLDDLLQMIAYLQLGC
jgi:hypothetical protein